MIYFFIGENSFEIDRTIRQITAEFSGAVEKKDPAEIESRDLPDILMGQTLFSDKRCVIIKQLSENKAVWNELPEWLGKTSDGVTLILVEEKPDKRTKTFKELQKVASVREFPVWSLKDTPKAVQWVLDEAKAQGVKLGNTEARHLVGRVGAEQWRLHQALEKLGLMENVSTVAIDDVTDAHPSENVFTLLETALQGDTDRVQQALRTLRQTEDPYRLFGLLGTQVLQLAALSYSEQSLSRLAGEIGAPPFVLTKLAPFASRLGHSRAKALVESAAETDRLMKSSASDPWTLIERLLLKITLA